MSDEEKKALCVSGSATSVSLKLDGEFLNTSKNVSESLEGREFELVKLDLGWVDEEFYWPKGETGLKTSYNCKGEIDPLLELTKGREVCVQAGGALGLFSKYLSRHFGRVYTFEPNPILFTALTYNVPEHNVYKFPMALTRNKRNVGMATYDRYEKCNMGAWWTEGVGGIPGMPLDSFYFDALDLLILDIEGGEFDALRGAEGVIKKHHPVIHIEFKKSILARAGVSEDELHDFFVSHGYELVRDKRNERTYV